MQGKNKRIRRRMRNKGEGKEIRVVKNHQHQINPDEATTGSVRSRREMELAEKGF